MTQKIMVYDIEIKKAIPDRYGSMQPGLNYCMGWHDHENMGIAVLCALDTLTGQMHTLTPEESAEDAETLHSLLAQSDYIVGFNSHGFDNKILKAQGYNVPASKSYDILEQVKAAAGAGMYAKGYKLEQIAKANGLGSKLEGTAGADAPALYQSGDPVKIAQLHDYCRQDVVLTANILYKIIDGILTCPVSGCYLTVQTPAQVLGVVQRGMF
jgi:hypothetical protein